MDIYQEIWEADMKGSGIRAIDTTTKNVDKTQGFVLVDTQRCHPDHRILKDVHIPENKENSYKLIEKLFDNYTLNQTIHEKNSTLNQKK